MKSAVDVNLDSNSGALNPFDRLPVALVQYELVGGLDRTDFCEKVRGILAQAVLSGAKLVVFPELFTADLLPGGRNSDPSKPMNLGEEVREWNRIIDEEVPALFEEWRAMANAHPGVAVLFGSTPRRLPDGGVVNSALFALGDGRVVIQDKLFLTPCEDREWKWRDGQELQVIDAPWGRTVVLICHDIEVPYLSSLLLKVQPDLVISPSCTGSIHGLRRVRFCSQARAVEHHTWVLQTSTIQPPRGAGGVATVNMNEHTGQAAIIPPSESLYEEFRKEGDLNESMVLYGEVDFRRMRKVRGLPIVFPARDERARRELPRVSGPAE